MKKDIKFIIETVTSERDVNGNCYHFAHVTRLSDGETFTTEVGGPSNARSHARQAGLEFENIYDVKYVIPKREFKHRSKNVSYREPELVDFFGGCKHNSGCNKPLK